MGCLEEYKPALGMVGLQAIYAGLAIFSRAALVHGMSPRVFVVYRNAIATIAMAPPLFFSTRYFNSLVLIHHKQPYSKSSLFLFF